METALRVTFALFMIAAGSMHFVAPKGYVRIMPKVLPAPLTLVYASGALEILGGIGLLVPMTQRYAAWGLVALLVAVFPANVNMAVNRIPLGRRALAPWMLWVRLPLQGVLIAWAWSFTF